MNYKTPKIAAAAIMVAMITIPSIAMANTVTGSVSVAIPYTEMASLPFRAGFALSGTYAENQWYANGSYRYQSGNSQNTGEAYLDNLPVQQNVINLRAGYTIFKNHYFDVTPELAYNYLSYGNLHNNGIGVGIMASARPVRWLTLYENSELLWGFDGNIAGYNLTEPANLYQFKGGASVPVGEQFSMFSSLEFSRYIGHHNTLTGYTIEVGVTKQF